MNTFKLTVVAAFVFLLSPLQGRGQQVEIYTDARSNKYAAINLKTMPRNTENRDDNIDFYKEVQLFESDETTPVTNGSGANVYVKRIARHHTNYNGINGPDKTLSRYFIISPDPVYSDGTTSATAGGKVNMSWAVANGYLTSANSQLFNAPPPEASAVQTGCPAYRGKDGQDTPGTWRVPTHREGAIIMAFRKELEATQSEGTNFASFLIKSKISSYWLATEFYGSNEAWYMKFNPTDVEYELARQAKTKTTIMYLRCIRDIPDTP